MDVIDVYEYSSLHIVTSREVSKFFPFLAWSLNGRRSNVETLLLNSLHLVSFYLTVIICLDLAQLPYLCRSGCRHYLIFILKALFKQSLPCFLPIFLRKILRCFWWRRAVLPTALQILTLHVKYCLRIFVKLLLL